MVDSLMQMYKFIEIATKFSIYRNIFERLSPIAYRPMTSVSGLTHKPDE
jgi:hypothetical protein